MSKQDLINAIKAIGKPSPAIEIKKMCQKLNGTYSSHVLARMARGGELTRVCQYYDYGSKAGYNIPMYFIKEN